MILLPIELGLPTIILRRLQVFRKGAVAYDQIFHSGVNIIRGLNGSGKSTIMDFIFHVLGGEVLGPTIHEWKEYASLCDTVVAEVSINNAVITLRREVTPEKSRPLHVFFDRLEIANQSVAEGWQTFPYSRQSSKESFSQILFRAMNIPEASTPEGSNITMHQMLRLLYSDQMTPVQRIFRFENFDPPILKQAIGDFLCGVGNFDLYEKQVELRSLQDEFDDISSELKAILAVGGDLEAPLAQNALLKETEELTGERATRYLELEEVARSDFGSDESAKSREGERRKAFEAVGAVLAKIQSFEFEIQTIEFEISDSEQFIQHLGRMLGEIEKATLTYAELGEFTFNTAQPAFRRQEPTINPINVICAKPS